MAVKRLTNIRPQFLNGNGEPLAGALLFSYLAGSSTRANTYNSSAGTTPNSNPIQLDAAGRPTTEIWLTSGVSYKLVFANPGDGDAVTDPTSPIWTEDDITGVNDTTTVIDQWVIGPAPTYISANSFSLVGDQTSTFSVGRRVRIVDAGGTKYGTIISSAYTSLTTVTIDTGGLSSPISSVEYGLLSPANNAIPAQPQDSGSGSITLFPDDFPSTQVATDTATFALPGASAVAPGRPIRIKSMTAGNVQVAPDNTDEIDGVNASLRVPSYETIELESNGVDGWYVTRKSQWQIGDWKWGGYGTAGLGWVKAGSGDLSRTDYAGLFAVYGTDWGDGDGSTTFGIPDAKGRMIIQAGTGEVVEDVTASSGNGFTVEANNDKWHTGMPVVLSDLTGFTTSASEGPTYYVVRISSTNIRLASTLALAQNDNPDITISGSGTATLTHTYTARTLGEYGGKESHAQRLAEMTAHTHPQGSSGSTLGSDGGPSHGEGVTGSRGGNNAMPIMNPFIVGELYIKT